MRRSGFTLIMAIFLLVALGGMLAAMLSYTTQTTQRGSDLFYKEQAKLLAKSATEFALLAIGAHDRTATGNCLSDINMSYSDNGEKLFDIRVSMRYFGLTTITCPSFGAITTPESEGTVLVDVTITGTDATSSSTPIQYHRRTIQKP